MKHIDAGSFVDALRGGRAAYHDGYLAMYSSLLDGIVTDPVLMLVPIDDHIVHRGDGVFEAFRCVAGRIYNMAAHLARLRRSASALCLEVPWRDEEIVRRVVDTVRAGKTREAVIRLYVSRGPGGFSADPYESTGAQMYIVVTRPAVPFMAVHPEGARVASSAIRPKDRVFAQVKSTNYVVNALMKKEAADKGVHFVVGFDANGNMTEGATENFGVVTERGRLVFPRLDGMLRGTTMMRVMELAQVLVKRGELRGVAMEDVPRGTIGSAREMLIVGTTHDVEVVREFDGQPVGTGRPGPVYEALLALLREDMRTNTDLLTDVFV